MPPARRRGAVQGGLPPPAAAVAAFGAVLRVCQPGVWRRRSGGGLGEQRGSGRLRRAGGVGPPVEDSPAGRRREAWRGRSGVFPEGLPEERRIFTVVSERAVMPLGNCEKLESTLTTPTFPSTNFSFHDHERRKEKRDGDSDKLKGGRENQVWYLKISKLALAFAIIHSKPPGKSCKEYTEHLAKTVSEQDFGWKSKVEVLEAEVLRLRQELLLNKICPRFCLENGKPDASAEILLDQECINPMSYSSQLEDSGCDVSNDYAFDSLGIASDFHQSEHNVNTSKCSLERVPPLNLCCTGKEESLTAPVQFLQHLLEIRKLSEGGILQANFTQLENDSFTIWNSVSQLLDGLTVFYNSPKFPVSNVLTEAVCVLISLITDTKLSNHVLKKCFKKLEEFKKNLIQIILRNSSVNRFQALHAVSNTLVLLGRNNIVRNSLISLLLSEVHQFAEQLLQAHQMQAMYDITQYENIFPLCMILEQLLQNETEESNVSSSDYDGEEKIEFLKKLDQIILHLSDEFPLFSLYLWRVSVLLNSAQIQID
ncbi:meiosis-specific protein MEI4 [Harpia harpyja]|uniref:meiosis-specific protein MEI4 n=1 Tax=Harpia harpyja TaxID=202280 RepID=UPI0022B1721B|nr:meiosis-specific protein MEI4 [Harpia harpyja]